MEFPHCKQFGFDEKRRAERLALLDLRGRDLELGRCMHREILVPAAGTIVDAFYDKLLRDRETRDILRHYSLDHLKRTQTDYLLSLGIDFDRPEYFEERLRVGLAHARVGIPLSLYLCAYRLLQQLIVDATTASMEGAKGDELIGFLLKITALDMSLAVETYHLSRVQNLKQSLERLKSEEALLRLEVSTDSLTGLASRKHVLQVLAEALAQVRRERASLSVIMGDLDGFKLVNDSYGHQVGDEVLRDVAQRMRSAVREFDVVGRYGGEEFLILLLDTPMMTARHIAERVRMRVADEPVRVRGDLSVEITISQVLAEARKDDTPESVIARADAALYEAKQAGKNRLRVAFR